MLVLASDLLIRQAKDFGSTHCDQYSSRNFIPPPDYNVVLQGAYVYIIVPTLEIYTDFLICPKFRYFVYKNVKINIKIL